ncbi:MAG: quinol:cytochrome C oxidoreductase, partial [Ignavibacteriae bacterium]|nr:quinol:cytochrome C oxidoreductase [Ignavibacteriota bacterium]
GPALNVWELGPFLAAIAGFFYLTFKSLSKHNLIPVNDPMLVESLPHS